MSKFWIFRKGTMEWIQWTIITWLLIPVLICPPSARAVKSKSDESESDPYPDSSVFPSQRPLLNYRTRVLGIRYGEPYSTTNFQVQDTPVPNLSSNYRKIQFNNNNSPIKSYSSDPKTEQFKQSPHPNDDEYEETDQGIIKGPGSVTEHQVEASTSRIPIVPQSLRRRFAYQIGTTPTTPVEPSTLSELKPKTSKHRRRKIKRPPKIKATTTKVFDEELGNPESSTKQSSSSSSSGDKNLALEIGSNDGKYALINQFFESEGSGNKKPPGIVSYATSDDFAHDNQETLGNLQENDIWLSEGHLLVLRGGEFDSSSRVKWKPIDDYVRDRSKPPLRIPLDTNNPPPFPVFVNETGPPVFLGPIPPFALPYPPPGYNGNETFDPSRFPPPGMIPLFPNGTIPNFFGPPPGGFNFGNHTAPPFPFGPNGGPPNGVNGPGRPGGLYGGGGPPSNGYGGGYGGVNNGQPRPVNQNGKPPFPGVLPPPAGFNGTRLPPPPFFPFGPPGGPPPPGFNPNFTGPGGPGPFPFLPPLVLNPNDNETDDPSIFLPPPYDFDYYEDNSTHVPPGPFAPGLVVPPPQEFYTVYNRTSPEPQYTTTPLPSTISSKVTQSDFRPQRPNAKRPKFPMTNPPDDSLEEIQPVTSPLPIIPITFPNKKRIKQRPSNGKTGKSYKYSNEKQSNEDISEERPNYPIKIVTPRPTTSTTTTSPKPLNYVYVRGQLKTLAEIAAEEAAQDYDDGPPTPRPPFDELGYPTRELGDDDDSSGNGEQYGGVGGYEYDKQEPSPTPKTAYHNTPKYDPNYVSDPYRKNPIQLSVQQRPTPTSAVYANSGELQGSKRGSGRNRNGNRIRVTPSSSPILVPLNHNNHNNNNNDHNNQNQRTPNKVVNEQGQVLYYPSNFQHHQQHHPNSPNINNNNGGNQNDDNDHNGVLGIVPTHYTPNHHHENENNNIRPVLQQNQPQNYPTNQPIYNNVLLNHQIHPTQAYHQQQPLTNSGFRPLVQLPQYQQQHQNQFQHPQQHHLNNPYQQQQIHPTQRQRGSRVIFPDQINNNGLQQVQPSPVYSTPAGPLVSPTPQGYYSPLSQFQQPIPTQGQFVPNGFYPGSAPGAGFPGTYQAQYFQPNLQNPQQQYFQQYQQQPQPQNLNEYAIQQQAQQQQQQIPLHRDILVNYREPLPQYNTESESVTTRSIPIQKAGPSPSGIYGTSLPAAEGSTQPNLNAASFYSFQRGGPGGFSYKIRL